MGATIGNDHHHHVRVSPAAPWLEVSCLLGDDSLTRKMMTVTKCQTDRHKRHSQGRRVGGGALVDFGQ